MEIVGLKTWNNFWNFRLCSHRSTILSYTRLVVGHYLVIWSFFWFLGAKNYYFGKKSPESYLFAKFHLSYMDSTRNYPSSYLKSWRLYFSLPLFNAVIKILDCSVFHIFPWCGSSSCGKPIRYEIFLAHFVVCDFGLILIKPGTMMESIYL